MKDATKPILVVEDDDALRQLYWQALTFDGFLRHHRLRWHHRPRMPPPQHPVGCRVDLNVPRLSGWQLHRELQSNPATRDIPVIVVTGAEPADVAKQVSALLVKPVPLDRIVEEVRKHVRAA